MDVFNVFDIGTPVYIRATEVVMGLGAVRNINRKKGHISVVLGKATIVGIVTLEPTQDESGGVWFPLTESGESEALFQIRRATAEDLEKEAVQMISRSLGVSLETARQALFGDTIEGSEQEVVSQDSSS
jgi:hypothetical protein